MGQVICEPLEFFNPLKAYVRENDREIENNYTRALFIALRVIASEGRLADWMLRLEQIRSPHLQSASCALDRWHDITKAVANSNRLSLRLQGGPKAARQFESPLVLVICGNAESPWTCGTRLVKSSLAGDGSLKKDASAVSPQPGKCHTIPDGSISAEDQDRMFLVESKTFNESVDALQVAGHLRRCRQLSDEEAERLRRQLESVEGCDENTCKQWAKEWRTALERDGRVLTVGWEQIGKSLKQSLKECQPKSEALLTSVIGYYRSEGLLGYEGIRQVAKFANETVKNFELWRALWPQLDTDSARQKLRGSSDPLSRLLVQSLELARRQLGYVAPQVDKVLAATKEGTECSVNRACWRWLGGKAENDRVRVGYDMTDIFVSWKHARFDKGALVIGTEVPSKWGLYIGWHEPCISPNFPGLSSDPGDLPKVSERARDHFAKWRNQWTKRLDCLPDGRWKFLCTVHPLRFRGKSTIWHGTALMCMNDEKQFKAMDEVRALTQDAGNEFWKTQFLYPDDVCPSQEWEQKRPLLAQKVRNPSLSLFIFPVSGHWGDKTFFDAVRAMAAWIDKWPDVN